MENPMENPLQIMTKLNFLGCLHEFLNELAHSYPNFSDSIADFIGSRLSKIRDSPNPMQPPKLDGSDTQLITEVYNSLKTHSKQILLQIDTIFQEQFRLHHDLNCDFSVIWKGTHSGENRKAIWRYLEHLYVFGHLSLHPENKERFLRVVQQLKATNQDLDHIDDGEPIQQQSQNTVAPPNPIASAMGGNPMASFMQNMMGQPQNQGPIDKNQINNAVQTINQMFGFGQNSNDPNANMFGEVIQDVASKVGEMMEGRENPAELLTAMMSGDMTIFNGFVQDMQQKFDQRIESGEIDRDAIIKQTQQMMGTLGMINPNAPNPLGTPGIPAFPPQMPQNQNNQEQPDNDEPRKRKKRKKKKKKRENN